MYIHTHIVTYTYLRIHIYMCIRGTRTPHVHTRVRVLSLLGTVKAPKSRSSSSSGSSIRNYSCPLRVTTKTDPGCRPKLQLCRSLAAPQLVWAVPNQRPLCYVVSMRHRLKGPDSVIQVFCLVLAITMPAWNSHLFLCLQSRPLRIGRAGTMQRRFDSADESRGKCRHRHGCSTSVSVLVIRACYLESILEPCFSWSFHLRKGTIQPWRYPPRAAKYRSRGPLRSLARL